MLIPQFSLRWILAVMAALSVVFLVVSLAVRGQGWAIAVSVACLTLAVIIMLHAACFGLTWIAAVVLAAIRRQPPPPISAPTSGSISPFAVAPRTTTSPFNGPA